MLGVTPGRVWKSNVRGAAGFAVVVVVGAVVVVAAAATGAGSTQFLRWEHLTILIKQASLNRDEATAPPAGRMKSAEH